jgi:hypothetical protein
MSPFNAWERSSFRRLSDRYPLLALGLAALLFGSFSTAWMLLQSPNFLSGYDFVRMHAYYRAFYREDLLSGRLPLWNPYVGLGRPFLADIETGTLYPPNLLTLPFGVYGGTALLLVLHQAVAFFGGERLGRKLGASLGPSLLVGAGTALASPFTARLASGALPVYFSLCWWPLLLWLGASLQDRWNRRMASGFAAVTALAILAGNPPILFIEFFGLFFFLLFRLDWRGTPWRTGVGNHAGLSLAAAIGACVAGAQLVPFAELISQGNRPLHAAGFAIANGMPPASWFSLFVPTSGAFGPNWEYDLYCGVVPLFAAVGGIVLWRERNVRGLLGLGLAGALLAAGDRTPFLGWIVHLVPGASALRLPSRYGIWLATSLIGLAAVALSRRTARPLLPILACLVACVPWIVWLRPYVVGRHGDAGGYYIVHVGALCVGALLLWLWHSRDRWRGFSGFIGCALGFFCAGDWLWSIHLQAPVYSLYGYETQEKAVHSDLANGGLLAPGTPPPRISFGAANLCEDAGMSVGFSSYNGYVNPSLIRVWNYLHVATGVPESTTDFIRLPPAIAEGEDRLNSLNLVASLEGNRPLEIHPARDPRAYVAFDAEVVPDWRVAEAEMGSGSNFHERVLLEAGMAPDFKTSTGLRAGSVEITGFDHERITVRSHEDRPGILVLSEAWYPGWRATTNGTDATVVPVNGWMRGVVVPAGSSESVFSYRPQSLATGMWISLLGAGALAMLFFSRSRSGPKATSDLG